MATEKDRVPLSTEASQVPTPAGAVFLSYASEDATAAERIASALRTAGIEVWFDKSALRGGDEWDRRIRQQIRDCALFVPLVSEHSQARPEGYFRLEWHLAEERKHLMGKNRSFLVPVCLDGLPERQADVPDAFLAVQWTRLPKGETSPAFVERIKRLLSPENSSVADSVRSTSSAVASNAVARRLTRRAGVLYGAIGATVLLALGYTGLERFNRSKPSAAGAASIAVLPLANESGEASQQYFSDGISEDLITRSRSSRG